MHDALPDVADPYPEIERLRAAVSHAERLNAVGRAIAAELDPQRLAQTVVDAATELTGAELGALFYSHDDGRTESYLLYAVSGPARDRFARLALPRNTRSEERRVGKECRSRW